MFLAEPSRKTTERTSLMVFKGWPSQRDLESGSVVSKEWDRDYSKEEQTPAEKSEEARELRNKMIDEMEENEAPKNGSK
jgi:hypothetical protein